MYGCLVGYCINRSSRATEDFSHESPEIMSSIQAVPFHWTLSQLFQKATEGYGYAKRCLAFWYLNRIDLRAEIQDRVDAFIFEAELLNPRAIICEGWCYQFGIGLPKDTQKAFDCYLKAHRLDPTYSEPYRLLGLCYLDGVGIGRNLLLALKYFQETVEIDGGEGEENNGISMLSLGFCFAQGVGMQRNQSRAIKFYLSAAEKGNSAAAHNLGLYYRNGYGGVTRDFTHAFHFIQKAAKDGNSDALFSLGRCYELGEGCIQDRNRALYHYKQAALMGDELSRQKIQTWSM